MFRILGFLCVMLMCVACTPKKPPLVLEQDQNLILPPDIDLLPNAENMDIPNNAANVFNN